MLKVDFVIWNMWQNTLSFTSNSSVVVWLRDTVDCIFARGGIRFVEFHACPPMRNREFLLVTRLSRIAANLQQSKYPLLQTISGR